MANTAQFDGHAAKAFRALADCSEDELGERFNKFVGLIGRRHGATRLIERQHGSTAKKIRKRLTAHRLI